jgi:hypothetical protein
MRISVLLEGEFYYTGSFIFARRPSLDESFDLPHIRVPALRSGGAPCIQSSSCSWRAFGGGAASPTSLFPRDLSSASQAAASARAMSSKKRVSMSPASAAGLKRHSVAGLKRHSVAGLKRQHLVDARENLQCLICQELLVDAVQVVCCGALHCRACISRCDRCPQCGKPVNAGCIVPDVRCDRLAAACLRPCLNAQHGCDFIGNRTSVTAHEEICDFVPRSVLREKFLAFVSESLQQASLVESLLARLQRQQTQADERAKLQQQFEREKINVQRAMMRCAFGSEPAKAALRVLYAFLSDKVISVVDRRKRPKAHRATSLGFATVKFAWKSTN